MILVADTKANMEVHVKEADMVADMKVDMVADMVVDEVADMLLHMVADMADGMVTWPTIFSFFLG